MLRNSSVLLLSIVVIMSSGLISNRANALEPVELGFHAGFINEPALSVIGVGPSVTFFDAVRVKASVGGLESALTVFASIAMYSFGATVQVRVPMLKISPLVGIGTSAVHLKFLEKKNKEGNVTRKPFTRTAYYRNIAVGLEWKATDQFYLNGGMFLLLKKNDEGNYKKDDLGADPEESNLPFLPFFGLGYNF